MVEKKLLWAKVCEFIILSVKTPVKIRNILVYENSKCFMLYYVNSKNNTILQELMFWLNSLSSGQYSYYEDYLGKYC